MYNLQTKEARINSQNVQFQILISSGYTREDYKGLKIFTKNEGKYFTLKLFKDEASHAIQYMNYHSKERRAQAIHGYKEGYDRQKAYKEEQKVKNKGYKSSHAATSAAIKAELKANFSGVKFSVTSEDFAGGNSVNISWNDGPTVKQVEEFTSKYQYGHFNGMEDMYENTNRRDDIPQAKYISESRSMSNEAEQVLKPIAEQIYNNDKSERNEYPYNCRDAAQFLYKVFYHSSIPSGATITDIIPTGETCGLCSPEVFYKIGYTLPEGAQKECIKATTSGAPTEPAKAGSIELIEYSEKSIAVIGETKPIKDILKELGGKFNFRLSCGAGWIFPKTKSEAVIKALQEIAAAKKQATPEAEQPEEPKNNILMIAAPQQPEDKTPIIATPETNIFILESFKIIWHEGRHIEGATFEGHIFNTWEDVQKTFVKLWEVNEKGQDAGYTKIKCEMKLKDNEIMIFRVDITDKIDNGDFNPSQEHIVKYLQSIADEKEETILRHPEAPANHPINICHHESSQYKQALKEYEDSHPKKYNSLLDIQQAAASGKQISMLNLFELHQSNN